MPRPPRPYARASYPSPLAKTLQPIVSGLFSFLRRGSVRQGKQIDSFHCSKFSDQVVQADYRLWETPHPAAQHAFVLGAGRLAVFLGQEVVERSEENLVPDARSDVVHRRDLHDRQRALRVESEKHSVLRRLDLVLRYCDT